MREPWALDGDDDCDVDDDNIGQDEFRIGDDPRIVLDQYLSREKLEELILDDGNVFDNNFP